MAVVVAVLLLGVDVVGVLQEGHPLRAVDDQGAGGGQGILHKLLQVRPVQGNHVRRLDLFHVGDRQSVVVEAGHLPGVQPLHRHAVYPVRHRLGGQIDRIGGGQNGQPGLLPSHSPGASAPGQQKGQGQQQGQYVSFAHGCKFLSSVQSIAVQPT